jgi:glycosyltransferase involved in cell wall biosynthesis
MGENIETSVMHRAELSATHVAPFSEGVAICSVGELFGGVERHILGLLGGLQLHGIETLLVLFHDGELAAQARAQGFEPIILPNRNRSIWAISQILASILRQRQIRIVHVHGYKATVFCALARFWYRFAMVKTEHGLPEPMTGRPLRALRDRLYHFLETTATCMTAATICYVTEELRVHHARAHAGLQSTVIPNGIVNMDRAQFKRPPELRENWFNLAIVGRLDTVKGHYVAIEALATPSVPPDAHLQIIGVGPMESRLRELVEVRGVADRVHFLGFRRNIYDYLAHCDVLLMPSLHEGLPYTLLEAMALGTPIIASRVGGLAEILRDGITGQLTPPGDPISITRAIVEFQRDSEYRRRLGKNAQHLQRVMYSAGTMASCYEAIYRRVSSSA